MVGEQSFRNSEWDEVKKEKENILIISYVSEVRWQA